MQNQAKASGVSPILLGVLATSLNLLLNEDEMNQAVEAHIEEIKRLYALDDKELASIGITRDQITAYVLHESVLM